MDFIPVNLPSLNGNELKYVTDCIQSGWISSEGSYVKRFEESFAHRVNRKFGIAVCNGSVALDLALEAIGLSEGDEVILPTFTIISCAAAIVRVGAIPVVVDCDSNTWNIKVEDIESKITSRTKAIMVVHIYGLPTQMDMICSLAERYNLKIIEDAAEAHGLTYHGKPCGSFGDISIFSFYPNKLITTGEGGMILTNSIDLANKCKLLRNLAFEPTRRFVHNELGHNFRMTNIQAAIGLAQLEQLDKFVTRKREIGRMYNELLADLAMVHLPIKEFNGDQNIYWIYGIVLNDEYKYDAQKVMQLLKDHGVESRPFFYPMHLQPVFKKMGFFKHDVCPNAERICERGFYIPSGLGNTEKQFERVASVLHEVLR